MSLSEELAQIKPHKDTLLSIGVFDGVHRGHQRLISALKESADNKGYLPGIITFDRHPEEILSPQKTLCYLTTLEQRQNLLEALTPDFIVTLPFTRDTAEIAAKNFLELLQKYLRMKGLVIGPNFILGKNREGNIAALRKLGETTGFTVEVVPALVLGGTMASSTTIRTALHNGNINKANKLLGRNFTLDGKVIPGVGQSTKIGFPTANINVSSQHCLPPNGVYATITHVAGSSLFSLTNIGGVSTLGRAIAHIPAKDNSIQLVETHILDFTGELKETTITIEFLEQLREELHFDDIPSLRMQINNDIKKANDIFKSVNAVRR